MESEPSPAPPAANWKLTLSYDGTDYCGWQVQPDRPTMQGELAAAIDRVTGEQVLPQGSGRTDAGVHALAQVASFTLDAAIPGANFMRALNRTLPGSLRVLSAEQVPADFHARHSAQRKTYEYRVLVCDPFTGAVCPPWHARFLYVVERPLDLPSMQQAAAAILGTHDFTAFAAFDPDRARRMAAEASTSTPLSNFRTIYASSWISRMTGLGLEFRYQVTGSGFLHHMVRNLVGTFLEVGWQTRAPESIGGILATRDRAAAGRTAPARGLFLHHVEY